MAQFDLTFKGAVLPDHDPKRVRARLAELFDIQDPFVIEQLFSGDTFILRGDLERKDAADYFRKIVDAGGQAELVPSSSRNATSINGATFPKRVEEGPATPTPGRKQQTGEVEQTWPVSGASRRSTSLVFEEEAANPLRAELQELETKRQEVVTQAEQEIERLQSLSRDIETKALEEIERLQGMRQRAESKSVDEQQAITDELDAARKAHGEAVAAAEDEAAAYLEEHDKTIAELDERSAHHQSESGKEISGLEKERQEVAQKAAEDIARLEQLLKDAREQARRDDYELAQLLQAARDDQVALDAQLAAEKARLEETAREVLTALQAQRDEAGSDSAQRIAELEQTLLEQDRKLQQELADLAAMEKEAEQRTRAAAEERQANCALVRKRLDESLGQLAGEEQALRQKLAARD